LQDWELSTKDNATKTKFQKENVGNFILTPPVAIIIHIQLLLVLPRVSLDMHHEWRRIIYVNDYGRLDFWVKVSLM
jgi:hypothetical protein